MYNLSSVPLAAAINLPVFKLPNLQLYIYVYIYIYIYRYLYLYIYIYVSISVSLYTINLGSAELAAAINLPVGKPFVSASIYSYSYMYISISIYGPLDLGAIGSHDQPASG